MLSSSSSSVENHHLCKPNVRLLTNPVLAGRSRIKKNESNPSTDLSRQSSLNDPVALPLSYNRFDKDYIEKKNKRTLSQYYDSSDSGIDLSLSTTSSTHQNHYQPINFHRSLSILNEDSTNHEEYSSRRIDRNISHLPSITSRGKLFLEDLARHQTHIDHNSSKSNSDEVFSRDHQPAFLLSTKYEEHHRRSSLINYDGKSFDSEHRLFIDDSDKKKSHKNLNDTLKINYESPKFSVLKPIRKGQLNDGIAYRNKAPTSSDQLVPEDQKHPVASANTNSSNEITPRIVKTKHSGIKAKAITPLGHYPNPDQIRAHINRSVTEKQHPIPLAIPNRNGVLQQMIPFDASPSKVNNLLQRQQRVPATVFYAANSNIKEVIFNESRSKNVTASKMNTFQDRRPKNELKQTNLKKNPLTEKKEETEQCIGREKYNDAIQKRDDQYFNSTDTKTNYRDPLKAVRHELIISDRHVPKTIHKNVDNHFLNDDLTRKNFFTNAPRRHQRKQLIQFDQQHPMLSRTTDPDQEQNQPSKYTEKALLIESNHAKTRYPLRSSVRWDKPQNGIYPYLGGKSVIVDQKHQSDQTNTTRTESIIVKRPVQVNRRNPMKPPVELIESPVNMAPKLKNNHVKPFLDHRTELRDSQVVKQEKFDASHCSSQVYEHMNDKRLKMRTETFSQRRSSKNALSKPNHQIKSSQLDSDKPPFGQAMLKKSFKRIVSIDEIQEQPSDHNSVKNALVDPSSQTSSHHTYPFVCTAEFDFQQRESTVDLSLLDNDQKKNSLFSTINQMDSHEYQQSSISLIAVSSSKQRSQLFSDKFDESIEANDVSTNYDSDDGWSDDSAELLYCDERPKLSKKKV